MTYLLISFLFSPHSFSFISATLDLFYTRPHMLFFFFRCRCSSLFRSLSCASLPLCLHISSSSSTRTITTRSIYLYKHIYVFTHCRLALLPKPRKRGVTTYVSDAGERWRMIKKTILKTNYSSASCQSLFFCACVCVFASIVFFFHMFLYLVLSYVCLVVWCSFFFRLDSFPFPPFHRPLCVLVFIFSLI